MNAAPPAPATESSTTLPSTVVADAIAAALRDDGWIRTDRNAFGRTSSHFTHPATTATITVTEDAFSGTRAFLFCDVTTDPDWMKHRAWKVDCAEPVPAALAASGTAILATGQGSGHDLSEVLAEAGWPAQQERARVSGRLLEMRFTGPDDTEAVLLPGIDEPDSWEITRPHANGRTTSYLASSDTPAAVLAALALTPAAV